MWQHDFMISKYFSVRYFCLKIQAGCLTRLATQVTIPDTWYILLIKKLANYKEGSRLFRISTLRILTFKLRMKFSSSKAREKSNVETLSPNDSSIRGWETFCCCCWSTLSFTAIDLDCKMTIFESILTTFEASFIFLWQLGQ
jgi:hypothetical protein